MCGEHSKCHSVKFDYGESLVYCQIWIGVYSFGERPDPLRRGVSVLPAGFWSKAQVLKSEARFTFAYVRQLFAFDPACT